MEMAATNTPTETVSALEEEQPIKSSTTADKVRSLQKSLSEVLEVVADSVKKLMVRGENLQDLEEQSGIPPISSELLKKRAESFDHYAGRLLKEEQKKHQKNRLILCGLLGIAVLLLILLVLHFTDVI